jgi:hypothetical protein
VIEVPGSDAGAALPEGTLPATYVAANASRPIRSSFLKGHLMFRNAVFAVALATATFAVSAVPVQALPLPPPGGDTLFVTAYYSTASKTTLVGQAWHGCGQPSGSWGTTTPYRNFFFPAC